MFLHLGGDCTIFIRDIIAIFDLEKTTITKTTREFLKICEEEGFVENISTDIPKSFVVTEKGSKSVVYLSPISVQTLGKRLKQNN